MRPVGNIMPMTPWQQFTQRWSECQECSLCAQRTKIVLLRGSVVCDTLFVGEAPGVSEDVLGLAFVGPAGKLLDHIVEEAARGLPPLTFGFTNLVACFPAEAKQTDNHQPQHEEIKACQPRLLEHARIARPRLIVTVGSLATSYLTPDMLSSDWAPPPRFADINHPAMLLRMPVAQKGTAVKRNIAMLRESLEELT